MGALILFILNILDYILTLINRGNFEEGNPLMKLILDNTLLIAIIKLIIVSIFIFILYKFRYLKVTKVGTIILTIIYLYAVILGVLYTILY